MAVKPWRLHTSGLAIFCLLALGILLAVLILHLQALGATCSNCRQQRA